ncbi:MAG TPA: hypothetical protein VFU59_02735 [Candidatus Eisenbacteria bacterium]|nr:hypothetical protein [Candidatus Eisenbacteria bacterium]
MNRPLDSKRPARRLAWAGAFATAAAALAILAAAPPPARAERLFLPLDREGSWTASDKTLHFAASFAIATSLRIEGRDEGAAVGVTFGIGVAKEVYDATFKSAAHGARGASRKDLVVDLLGAAAGILFVRALDR